MDHTGLPLAGLGLILGMKHALDADHLAAVSSLAAGKGSRRTVAFLGAWWGLGHAVSLLAAGGAILFFDLKFPPALALVLEFGVGCMLIVLGGRVLFRLRKGEILHVHAHRHQGRTHIHPHLHPAAGTHGHVPHHRMPAGNRSIAGIPLAVGMVHGLAGSAGLTLVLLPAIQDRLAGMLYLALFGAGSVAGMTLVTVLAGIPLARLQSGSRTLTVFSAAAGVFSVVVGALLMVETGGALIPL